MKRAIVGTAVFVAGLLASTSDAYAWGVCGRGPWVDAGMGDWGETSTCTCGNGTVGQAKMEVTSGQPGLNPDWAYVQADGGSNTGVGIELEGIRYGESVRIPVAIYPSGQPFTVQTGWYRAGWDMAPYFVRSVAGYESVSIRYRSVCINNFSNFSDTHHTTDVIWSY